MLKELYKKYQENKTFKEYENIMGKYIALSHFIEA